jgi:hypothetical protein
MKAILEYTLPDDQDDYDNAHKATRMAALIDDIYTHVFRPAYKHGYSSHEYPQLTTLTDRDIEVIEALHTIYTRLREEHGV